jgi:PBP1b-binding outer membrane lipoprotein LpoB
MKIKSVLIILVLTIIVLLSGCINQTETQKDVEKATLACVNECKAWLNAGKDLSNGPCLLDPIPDTPDWVCDVAHSPRIPEIDNQPVNQCSTFREGKAHHFVEVNSNCETINTW